MKVSEEDVEYFGNYLGTINQAFSDKSVAIILCENKDTGDVEPTLCKVKFDKTTGNTTFSPLAILFRMNPFDILKPIVGRHDGEEMGVIVVAHQGELDKAKHASDLSYFINNKNLN